MAVNYGEAYKRLEKKIENGEVTKGTDYNYRLYFDYDDISEVPMEKRTSQVCASLMAYSKCKLVDVPEESLTRDFYLNGFCHKDVKEYIKNHPDEFDRDFFKDLIETSKYCTNFEDNCFTVMSLEHIDTEMCILAMLKSTDWTEEDWFRTVLERKPEVLTYDLWLCAVQFYTQVFPEIVELVPTEFRTNEFYFAALSPTFNCGMSLSQEKEKMLELLSEDVFTMELVKTLLLENIENTYRLPTKCFFEVYDYIILLGRWGDKTKTYRREILWKAILKTEPSIIKKFYENDEIVKWYINHYGKDSFEVKLYMIDHFGKYSDFYEKYFGKEAC